MQSVWSCHSKHFAVLANLTVYQAWGIFLGLSREEVLGLTEKQIETYLKYQLPKEELIALNDKEVSAFLALRNCEFVNKHAEIWNQEACLCIRQLVW